MPSFLKLDMQSEFSTKIRIPFVARLYAQGTGVDGVQSTLRHFCLQKMSKLDHSSSILFMLLSVSLSGALYAPTPRQLPKKKPPKKRKQKEPKKKKQQTIIHVSFCA